MVSRGVWTEVSEWWVASPPVGPPELVVLPETRRRLPLTDRDTTFSSGPWPTDRCQNQANATATPRCTRNHRAGSS
ncbi:hypothetical protein ACFFX0_32230 [Citricoccus parietis]|uniref:Uncharacterized protein n=1 Tax=Citricoccus parietis TaxID=592307 RepID=A0ABV5G9E9_9MICC